MSAKIQIKNGKKASQEVIANLESVLNCNLSDSFREFLQTSDGGEPENNIFRIDEKNESGVNKFIPAKEIWKEREHIGNLGDEAFPVAWAEGGNYVVIDQSKKGAVFFWDHEISKLTQVAGDFNSFLDSLKPFNSQDVKPKPGQVKRAWIDPEFLKKHKNK